jgi:hypothetical protein
MKPQNQQLRGLSVAADERNRVFLDSIKAGEPKVLGGKVLAPTLPKWDKKNLYVPAIHNPPQHMRPGAMDFMACLSRGHST